MPPARSARLFVVTLDDAVVLYSFRQSYIFSWLCCSSILYCFVYYILSCLFNFIIVQIAYSRLRMNRLGFENVNGILFYQIKFYWHCSRHDLVALGCRRFGGDCSRLKSLYHIHGLVTQVAMNTSLSQRFKCALYSRNLLLLIFVIRLEVSCILSWCVLFFLWLNCSWSRFATASTVL